MSYFLSISYKGAQYLRQPEVKTVTTKIRIGMDVDEPTAEWIRKLKSEYVCNSNRELFLLALSALEKQGLPPEVHLVAIEKGEPIEDDPLALLWRNICSQQRRIDNFQVHTRKDLETLTRLIGEQRRQLKIYSEKSMIELRELLHIVESRIQELKEEKADLKALNRRSRESEYLI